MSTDLNILKTIAMYYPHPHRLFYTRCWGCRKRRLFAEWWEGYQSTNGLDCQNAAALAHWGYFCSSCIVIIASMIADRLRYCRDELRIDTLDEAMSLYTEDDHVSGYYKKIGHLRNTIVLDQQIDAY